MSREITIRSFTIKCPKADKYFEALVNLDALRKGDITLGCICSALFNKRQEIIKVSGKAHGGYVESKFNCSGCGLIFQANIEE